MIYLNLYKQEIHGYWYILQTIKTPIIVYSKNNKIVKHILYYQRILQIIEKEYVNVNNTSYTKTSI